MRGDSLPIGALEAQQKRFRRATRRGQVSGYSSPN